MADAASHMRLRSIELKCDLQLHAAVHHLLSQIDQLTVSPREACQCFDCLGPPVTIMIAGEGNNNKEYDINAQE